jgi:ATP-dependent RNA helicase RhlE
VINYDIPDTTDAYTHRIGRTGRAAKTGDAFTFVTREDEPLIRSIERVLNAKIERRTLKDFDYKKSAPARDTEFARPPRTAAPRTQPKTEHGGSHGAGHGEDAYGSSTAQQPQGSQRRRPVRRRPVLRPHTSKPGSTR